MRRSKEEILADLQNEWVAGEAEDLWFFADSAQGKENRVEGKYLELTSEETFFITPGEVTTLLRIICEEMEVGQMK